MLEFRIRDGRGFRMRGCKELMTKSEEVIQWGRCMTIVEVEYASSREATGRDLNRLS